VYLHLNSDFITHDTVQTVTNKTLTSPTITSPTVTDGTFTDPVIEGTELNGPLTGDYQYAGRLQASSVWSSTGTNVATFNSIPTWAKKITVSVRNVTITTATDGMSIRIGTGGTVSTSGYTSVSGFISSGAINDTTGFFYAMQAITSTSMGINGQATITLVDGTNNIWECASTFSTQHTTPTMQVSNGSIALAGAIDILTVNTISNITAGSISLLFEG
jgi:hypothetical protein